MYINWFPWIIFFVIEYVIPKIGGNDNSPNFLNLMENWYYHGKRGNYPAIPVYVLYYVLLCGYFLPGFPSIFKNSSSWKQHVSLWRKIFNCLIFICPFICSSLSYNQTKNIVVVEVVLVLFLKSYMLKNWCCDR